ncbi:MAG: ABC transporter ATP-binding protein [Alphaproteobacteria bacterium]|nr:ABC transporter ATP-binding protein [Alphaproteobacteria bacterium]
MSEPVLAVRDLTKSFGALRALGPVSFALRGGERLGLIGPNGSGKTTLINCLSGTLRADDGRIWFAGRDVTNVLAFKRARMGLARSFQIPKPFVGMTVLENVLVPLDQIGDGSDHEARAMAILRSVRLDARAGDDAKRLSHLELRKLELARALVGAPKVLIADEAMAGLSEPEIDEILAILQRLSEAGVAVIMVEHIMHAVMRFSQRVICFETGQLIAEGTPQEVAEDPLVQKVYFGEPARH